jgi:hypothetical protein
MLHVVIIFNTRLSPHSNTDKLWLWQGVIKHFVVAEALKSKQNTRNIYILFSKLNIARWYSQVLLEVSVFKWSSTKAKQSFIYFRKKYRSKEISSCKATYSMLIFVLVIKLKYETSVWVEIQNIPNWFVTTESPQKTIRTDFIQPPLIILKHYWPGSLNERSNILAGRLMENALYRKIRSIQSGFTILV